MHPKKVKKPDWTGPLNTKAGVTRNQHGLCKQILPVQCSSYCVSTSQKVSFLAHETGRYNAPLQLSCGRILKNILSKEKREKIILLHQMFFFCCRTQIKGFHNFFGTILAAYVSTHVMTCDHICDYFSLCFMSATSSGGVEHRRWLCKFPRNP